MNTYSSFHTDRKTALLLSFLIAALIVCFLVCFRILIPSTKAAIHANVDDLYVISCPIIQDLPEPAIHEVILKNTPQQAGLSTVSGKEELNRSETGLFSNYKANSYKAQPSEGSTVTDETKTGSTPFPGPYTGIKTTDNGKDGRVNLAGRKVVHLPKATDTNESGVVVVNIVVDKTGKVTQAEANGRGTNTPSNSLKSKACKAALEALFSPSTTGEEQHGSITYVFEF